MTLIPYRGKKTCILGIGNLQEKKISKEYLFAIMRKERKKYSCLREAAKKLTCFSGSATKRGGGKGLAT